MELTCREYGEGALVKLRRAVRDGMCDAFQKEFGAAVSVQPLVAPSSTPVDEPLQSSSLPGYTPRDVSGTSSESMISSDKQQKHTPNDGDAHVAIDGPEISTSDSASSPIGEDRKKGGVTQPLVARLSAEKFSPTEVEVSERNGRVNEKSKNVHFEVEFGDGAAEVEGDLSEKDPLNEISETPDTKSNDGLAANMLIPQDSVQVFALFNLKIRYLESSAL